MLPRSHPHHGHRRRPVVLSPSVSIGYTFGARVNYGADLDFGYYTTDKNGAVYRAGLSLSHYLVEARHHVARISTVNVMFQKDFTDLKAGIGRLRNKWGYQNRNVSTVYGFSYDLSLRLPDPAHNTWFGLKHFVYKPADWPWFEIPYTSLFLKYKYDIPAGSEVKSPFYGKGTAPAP
jgi:hypothetical protein